MVLIELGALGFEDIVDIQKNSLSIIRCNR